MFSIGPTELLLIFGICLLIFGASKLPEIARALGKAKGEFKKALIESEREAKELEEKIKSKSKNIEALEVVR